MSNPAPTLVSTFELLFTPQLPTSINVGGMSVNVPPSVAAVDEIALKGYFLTIANINPKAYTFTLGFHINPGAGGAPPAAKNSLKSALGFIDNTTGGAALKLNPSGTAGVDFYSSVTVGADSTTLIALLPAFISPTGFATDNIEVRGWVDITLPAVRGPGSFINFVPQSSTNVSTLLTAEQRLTFLPMGAGAAATAVESQAAFAVPLAGGASLVSIPPQPGGLMLAPVPGV